MQDLDANNALKPHHSLQLTKPVIKDGFDNKFDAPVDAGQQFCRCEDASPSKTVNLDKVSLSPIGTAQASHLLCSSLLTPVTASKRAIRSLTSNSARLALLLYFKTVRWCTFSGY